MEENEEMYPEEYKEYKEGTTRLVDTHAHQFREHEEVKYIEPNMTKFNLGDQKEPKLIVVGDD